MRFKTGSFRNVAGACLLSSAGVATAVSAAEIAAGWTHSVAVQDGCVWTWGDNACGQLGLPEAGRVRRPRRVEGVKDVKAVAASWHTLAVTADGHVFAWGRNDGGQLGNGRFGFAAQERVPAYVDGLPPVAAVAAGWDHSLALTRDGEVYAWGDRSHGQLGDGVRQTGKPAAVPQPVPGLSEIIAIAAGGQHSLALRRDGTVLAWGSNWNGQLGNGSHKDGSHSAVPRPVIGERGKDILTNAVAIAAGALHSAAVTRDGRCLAWGYNGSGQIPVGGRGSFWGDGGARNVARPAQAMPSGKQSLPACAAVAAGYESTYALTAESGHVLAAGWAQYGELGSGTSGGNRDTLGPVTIGCTVVWPSPSAGEWHPALVYRYTDLAHLDKGVKDLEVVDPFTGPPLIVKPSPAVATVTARVARNAGQVETQAALEYPAQAAPGRPVAMRLARLMFGSHSGDNDFATAVRLRLTQGTTGETVDLPLVADTRAGGALPPLGGIVSLAAGLHHALARDRDGALWAWGHNGFGQLGDGNVADSTVAVRLAPFDDEQGRRATRAAAPVPAPVSRAAGQRPAGVAGDGITLDQAALQAAIDACSRRGGGTVRLPPGVYLTGSLVLRDGVTMHLEKGATLLAAPNRQHLTERALIFAKNARDIAITGEGVLDGQGHVTGARDWRHNVILMEGCRNVRIEGISTVNAGAWTEHYIRCVGLTIKNVTVRSLRPGRNNDGIDLSGCEQVRIEGCTVISDDDAIVIKSQSADRVNRDIEVVNNVCHTYRGAFKLGTETRGVYQDLTCRGLTCYGAKALELYSVDGSEIERVTVENVRAYDALIALNIRLGARLRPSYWAKGLTPQTGVLRDIRIRDVAVEIGTRSWREVLLDHGIPDAEWATGMPEAPYDSCISGLPGHRVEKVVIDGFKVRVPGGAQSVPDAATLPERPDAYPHGGNFGPLPAYGLFVRHAQGVTLKNASFESVHPDARPPVAFFDAPDFSNLVTAP
ncbi:MAG TPA: glycosyl hydrolase family 28 protein [Kiritimatiellia bacterium]|nr:MAG: Endo-polygalacturonase precursor [Verrucomicrobia bacterium ADurb.Bin070]HQQ91016.1 glycosyl hydrolase family 28 protein [Kiritimatiellia bacterium]